MEWPRDNTVKEAWQWLLKGLSAHMEPREAGAVAREIFFRLLGLQAPERVLRAGDRLSESAIQGLKKAMQSLHKGMPVQYVTGWSSFLDLELRVDPRVLIPRPETEELVGWVMEKLMLARPGPPLRLLDVGTGSGCVAIALSRLIPQAEVMASDVTEDILELARSNADRHEVQVRFFLLDLLDPLPARSQWEGALHVLVSNPPYVRESEKALMQPPVLYHEPARALFVPDEDPLLFHRHLAHRGVEWLEGGGHLFMEINEALETPVCDLPQALGYDKVECRTDMHEKPRFVYGQKT